MDKGKVNATNSASSVSSNAPTEKVEKISEFKLSCGVSSPIQAERLQTGLKSEDNLITRTTKGYAKVTEY